MYVCMHARTMYTYTGVVSYGSIFRQKCIQHTVIWSIAEDATPPVLNQLPYSLKSYDDKAVRENGRRDLTGTLSPAARNIPCP